MSNDRSVEAIRGINPLWLITRPAAAATSLAEALRDLGREAFIEPLLSIAPLVAACPVLPNQIAALALTSAAALNALDSRRSELAPFLDLPCFCVGSRTAAAARAFGFTDVREGPGEGGGLVALIEAQKGADAPLLHIGGEELAPGWQAVAEAKGPLWSRWIVYRAVPAPSFSPALQTALREGWLSGGLFFSARTAETFVTLAQKAGLGPCCASLTAIGLSEAVLAPLKALPWRDLRCAAAPTETALLTCLPHN